MPYEVIRADITKLKVDAIVNASNSVLSEGVGVSAAIYAAAGRENLISACKKIGYCATGQAVITKGYKLAKYIIHTAGPVYGADADVCRTQLYSCYYNSLKLAKENKAKTIAFPLISTGTYGYPKAEAMAIADKAIRDFLYENKMKVFLVVYDDDSYHISNDLFARVKSYIDQKHVKSQSSRFAYPYAPFPTSLAMGVDAQLDRKEDDQPDVLTSQQPCNNETQEIPHTGAPEYVAQEHQCQNVETAPTPFPCFDAEETAPEPPFIVTEKTASARSVLPPKPSMPALGSASRSRQPAPSLELLIERSKETFSEMLLRLIDQKGMTDVEVYKRANIDRKLFSKIRKKDYIPKKNTVLALIIALKLNMDEATDLLKRAGYALSEGIVFDIIIEFSIINEIYDLYTINQMLFSFDQPIIGA